jgi:hypothetical protein
MVSMEELFSLEPNSREGLKSFIIKNTIPIAASMPNRIPLKKEPGVLINP